MQNKPSPRALRFAGVAPGAPQSGCPSTSFGIGRLDLRPSSFTTL